jgi:carboxyl-terminal processing protease
MAETIRSVSRGHLEHDVRMTGLNDRMSHGVALMKQHRRSLSLVALMAVASVASVIVWLNNSHAQNRYELVSQYLGTLNEILVKADGNYYKEVDEEKMLQGAIRGAVAALNDPYSFYQSPEDELRERQELFDAKFGGLGILIDEEQRGEIAVIKVVRVLPNTPAMRAQLQAGDAILAVNGESVILGGDKGLTKSDVVMKLRGRVGEAITITVERRTWLRPRDITLTREEIRNRSVESAILEPGIAYITLREFTSSTYDEFVEELRDVQKSERLRALILDLRYNRGGLLEAAKNVSDAFLSDGVVVSMQGRRSEYNRVHKADRELLVPNDVEVVVLVNESSASGSEIVAGALKDRNRAILVGTKTFGKGVVQERMKLRNGGALSLTIASYYTPNGVSIDGQGIEPNVRMDAETLSDHDAFIREKIRDKGTLTKFVVDFITEYEKTHGGETPHDSTPIENRIGELIAALDKQNLHMDERNLRYEVRRVFDANVGNDRLYDLEYDRQLAEALHIVKDVGVANVLNGSYKVATKGESSAN